MSEQLQVEPINPEHANFVGQMIVAKVLEAPRNFSMSTEQVLKFVESGEHVDMPGGFILLNDSSHPVGMAFTNQSSSIVHISNMYITPEARQLGGGDMLLNVCEEQARREGYCQTEVVVGAENYKARAFYKRRGYKVQIPRAITYWDIHPGIYGETLVKEWRS